MNCRDAQRRLDAYVDHELELTATLEIEAHLAACKRCRIEQANLQTLVAAVREQADPGAAPRAFARELHKRYGRKEASSVRSRRRYVMGGFAAGAALGALSVLTFWIAAPSAPTGLRVVYHISQAGTARSALRTLSNHLEAAPGAQVVVVAHSDGITFLLDGARDEAGEPYERAIRTLAARGVQFRVCNNTLVRQRIDAARLVSTATLVPSGIAEIARLQSEGKYVYMRL